MTSRLRLLHMIGGKKKRFMWLKNIVENPVFKKGSLKKNHLKMNVSANLFNMIY